MYIIRPNQRRSSGKGEEMRYIAELTKWNGEKETIKIKKEWIDDIVTAVKAQIFIANNKQKFSIVGSNYCHVDIYSL